MKNLYNILKVMIGIISVLFMISGIILTCLAVFDFFKLFFEVQDPDHLVKTVGVGMLQTVDLLLIAIVFFVLSIGIMVLFKDEDKMISVKLPRWLYVKNFMQLKVILWEAILTTLVVSYLANLAQNHLGGTPVTLDTLIVPGGIFLISLSLFFLKRGEKE